MKLHEFACLKDKNSVSFKRQHGILL